jgi:two-component system response regulator YesN
MTIYRTVIVDDEPIAIQAISVIFSRNFPEFEVVGTASNGQEAYELIRKEEPDLVLTDISMPLMSGVELTEKVRAEMPDVNFVFISGYQDFEYMRAAIRNGVLDYLSKPISPSVVQATMERVKQTLKEVHYERKNEILRQVCTGGKTDPKQLRRYFPYKEYYAAIIRQNGLPRRLSGSRAAEIYADIEELYAVYGRDSEEELYLIPAEMLQEKNLRSYMETVRDRQTRPGSYSTILYYGKTFTDTQTREKLQGLYRWLNAVSCVGVDQIIDLDSPRYSTGEIPKPSTAEVDVLLQDLEGYVRSGHLDQLQKYISAAYDRWGAEKRPQIWMEYASRQILSFLRRETGDERSLIDSEYVMEEVFFSAETAKQLKEGLFTLFFQSDEEAGKPRLDSSAFFEKITDYLSAHISEPVSLQSVSDTFAISQTYMSRIFRKYAGISFNQYLTKVRMEKARKLLEETPDLFVKDVASMVGYEDQFYFSRIFRTYEGKPPSAFLGTQEKQS